jgi:hypothetical protein
VTETLQEWIERNVQAGLREVMDTREERARYLIRMSLPAGLQWLVRYPRLLRALRRLHLWQPPVLYVMPTEASEASRKIEEGL